MNQIQNPNPNPIRIVEVLSSVSISRLFCKLSDGSYRWLTWDLRLQNGGPQPAWVERGRTAKAASLYGLPNISQLLGGEIHVRHANQVNGFLDEMPKPTA
jgi:hypothetical protein